MCTAPESWTQVTQVSAALADAQAKLIGEGANIGRSIVKVVDPVTADPLFVSGDDAIWSYRSHWFSPLVAGYVRGAVVSEHASQLLAKSRAAGAPLP
jgi:hypothetical protein